MDERLFVEGLEAIVGHKFACLYVVESTEGVDYEPDDPWERPLYAVLEKEVRAALMKANPKIADEWVDLGFFDEDDGTDEIFVFGSENIKVLKEPMLFSEYVDKSLDAEYARSLH